MRFRPDLSAARVRGYLPHAGLAAAVLAFLAAGIAGREHGVCFLFGVPVALGQFLWGTSGALALAAFLACASLFLLPPDGSQLARDYPWLVLFCPLYLALVWAFCWRAHRIFGRDRLRIRLAEEEEKEARAELAKELGDGLRHLAGSRQRIEKILMLTNLTNDLSSTLDLKGVIGHALAWTREVAGQSGEPELALLDEHGESVYRLADGALTVAREEFDPISQWVRERMMPLFVADLSRDLRFRAAGWMPGSGIRSVIATPLTRGKSVIGVLRLQSGAAESFTPEDWRLISLTGDLASIAIQNSLLYQRTQEEAITDGLTELFVHRYFQERLREELRRSREAGIELSLLMVDIDDFKVFNDTWGHLAGDAVLKRIALTLREGVRGTDIAARYGGEEFAVLLVETAGGPGFLVADRLRAAVEKLAFDDIGLSRPVTVSVGVASFPVNAQDERSLVERADEALYAAKRAGKNRAMAARLAS